ncbi:MAG TPA: putative zinc-binding protein [Methanomassiliicoccales archaeon]|nr:putative zinc-binding protein [Methanomassiliicoccales archaeon]
MRKGVMVCGANGERGLILEKAIEIFSKNHQDKIVQFSVNTFDISPIIVRMSGIDMDKLVAVNGCKNRCVDRLLEKNDLKAQHSCVVDDALERRAGPCKPTSQFEFEDPTDEEISAFVEILGKTLE